MAWFVAPLFFLIALVYSSVGFGGGSLYLAVLAFTLTSQDAMRIIALICNSLATTSGSWNFLRESRMPVGRFIPLLACSIPACILTSTIAISDVVFFGVLAVALIIAGILMLIRFQQIGNTKNQHSWHFYSLTAAIGALAGLTGIGGGVYLAPYLTLKNWGTAKEISAVSAIFILTNSLAGLITRLVLCDDMNLEAHGILWIATIVGGFIGSYFSSKSWPHSRIRQVTGLILIIAGTRILLAQLL